MFGTPSGRSQTTIYLSFLLVDRVTLPDYRAPRSNLVPRSRSVAQHKNKTYPLRKSERYIDSLVQSATRLTAYHIYGMWLSTFKNLTTATSHRDLSKFINTDGVSHKVMISNTNPSVVLIVIAESKQELL